MGKVFFSPLMGILLWPHMCLTENTKLKFIVYLTASDWNWKEDNSASSQYSQGPTKKKKLFWCVWYIYYVHICVWVLLLMWVHVEGDQSQCWKNVFLNQFSTYFLQTGCLAEPGWSLLFLLDCLASKLLWSSSPTTAKVASTLVITTDVLLYPFVSPITLSFLTCFLLLHIERVFLRSSGTILST